MSARNEDPLAGLLAKLRLRDNVSDHEAQVLRDALDHVESHHSGYLLVEEGEMLTESTLLVSGFVGRSKDLAGGERQITELHLAGDFVDLHGFLLKRIEHSIRALTAVRIAKFSHAAIQDITEREPHLARLLWLMTLIDAAIQRERILTLGRRTAVARIAHLICELLARLEAIGLSDGTGFRFPVVQADLADASGLTPVHVNRMLRDLRERNLMTFRSGNVEIRDRAGLEALAEFDTDYLSIVHMPR